jgi:hypothetical protein
MPQPNAVRLKIPVLLGGSDRRSIGGSDEVAKLVLKQPKLFRELIACLWHDDPIVRMRAADAAEKVSAQNPPLLARYKTQLLGLLAETEQIEVRWHLAQMIPRLQLNSRERQRTAAALRRYLDDRSSIVRTWSLNALAALSQHDATLRSEARQLLEEARRSGTAAMKARARKLLQQFKD